MWACVWACGVGGGFRIFGQRAKSVNSATIRVLVGEDIHNSDLPVCTRYRLDDASNWPLVGWQVVVLEEDHISDRQVWLRTGPFVPFLERGEVLLLPSRPEVLNDALHPLPT